MSTFIPYGRQDINQEDIEAVVRVLQSDWLTQGPVIERFEQAIADYCGVRYAVAVSSATAALHIACLSLDLGSNETLWTSPITFVASANCALYCGANVDFVDIDAQSYNMSLKTLKNKLIQAREQNCLPKVVVPVHLAGQSCDMAEIANLAQEFGFHIIEDASHAIGGQHNSRPVGCCEFSDLAVFSFHPVKIITTGEGGMVLTNREDLYQRLVRVRSHGITRDAAAMTEASHGSWYYQQLELGFNYRITDIQAALGLSQLQRLDEFVTHRRLLAQRYNRLLEGLPVKLPWQHEATHSSWHLYILRLNLQKSNKAHKVVFEELRQRGIGVNLHYIPVYSQPFYRQFGFVPADFPEAESYYREAISIPLFSSMTLEQQDQVVEALWQVIGQD